MKIGVMFGSPETTTGGNALKFYASVRLDIRRIGAIKNGEQVVGNRTRVKVVKNKLAPPFREVEFDILYGEGVIARGRCSSTWASEANIVEKSGAWLSYEGERIGQGRENAKKFLIEHPEIAARIEADLLLKHGMSLRLAANGDPAAPKPEAAKPEAAADKPEAAAGKPDRHAGDDKPNGRPRARA